MMMMKNYIHFSTRIENFLFKGFNITTDNGFIALVVGVCCIGVIAYALLEVVRSNDIIRISLLTVVRNRQLDVEYLSKHNLAIAINEDRDMSVLESLAVRRAERNRPVLRNVLAKKWKHMICLILFLISDIILMAIAMTYNGYLIIAMIAGCNIGHFTFTKLSEENMPPLRTKSSLMIVKKDDKAINKEKEESESEVDEEPLDIS